MSPDNYQVRRLAAADVHIFRPVRLAALRLHPEAYMSAYEDELEVPLDDLAQRLLTPPVTMYGGFAGDALVGTTGLHAETRMKTRHRADIFFVYVDPAHRRTGLARRLVEAAIADARAAGLILLQLTVAVGNHGARRLYTELGFQSWGIERRTAYIGGTFHHAEHMALDLD